MDKSAIGQRLRELRGDRTQEAVATAVHVTPMAVSKYENGQMVPTDDVKIKLAAYFNTTVDAIFFNHG